MTYYIGQTLIIVASVLILVIGVLITWSLLYFLVEFIIKTTTIVYNRLREQHES